MQRRGATGIIILFTLPALFMLGYFVLIPICKTFYYSFFRWNAISDMVYVGWRNYLTICKDQVFRMAVSHVLIYIVTSLVLEVVCGLVLAFWVASGIRGQKFYQTVFFQPIVLPATAVALMFLLVYEPSSGLLNAVLKGIGLKSLVRYWLADRSIAFYAAMMPRIWQNMGLIFIIILCGIKSIPQELFEVAYLDGISKRSLRMLRLMIVPMIWNVLQICIIMTVVSVMKSFEHIFALTEGGPNHATEVLGTLLYDTIFRSMEYGAGSSIAVMIFVAGLFFTFVFKKFFSGEKIEF